jgi:two-component system cell cycle sensor histidine kinase/response regulator CckA
MKSSLHILHLEDNPRDAELISSLLESDGLDCAIRHVKTKEEFESAIVTDEFDVILSDFALPNYNGLSALQEARRKVPAVPFILLSGTVGEEVAIQSLKTGATDYVLKQRPARLVQAIRRALEETEERARLQIAEDRVREQAALLDKAQDAIHVRDMDEHIRYWNRGSERLYGWTTDEAFGRNANEFPLTDPASELDAAKAQVLANGEWLGELCQTTKTGQKVIVESRWNLVRDEQGNPKSVLVINTDVTEKRQIEAQFLRTQRMETIGALAGGIVHDLNNVLAPVLMAADVLEGMQTTDESREMLRLVRTSAQRGSDMVKQILSFTRGVSGERTRLDLKVLISDMVRMAKDTFPRGIRIETSLPADTHPVRGNQTQLHQVLLNLCVNARDAMTGKGKISICAENVALEKFRTRWQHDGVSGEYVRLIVSDTGHGIPPPVMENLFEPFFTTKEIGKGTGLGLSTVMAIVKQHGGFIDVQSEPGKGTSFLVYLPSARAASEVQQTSLSHELSHRPVH